MRAQRPELSIHLYSRDNVLFGSELDEARYGTFVLCSGIVSYLNFTC